MSHDKIGIDNWIQINELIYRTYSIFRSLWFSIYTRMRTQTSQNVSQSFLLLVLLVLAAFLLLAISSQSFEFFLSLDVATQLSHNFSTMQTMKCLCEIKMEIIENLAALFCFLRSARACCSCCCFILLAASSISCD